MCKRLANTAQLLNSANMQPIKIASAMRHGYFIALGAISHIHICRLTEMIERKRELTGGGFCLRIGDILLGSLCLLRGRWQFDVVFDDDWLQEGNLPLELCDHATCHFDGLRGIVIFRDHIVPVEGVDNPTDWDNNSFRLKKHLLLLRCEVIEGGFEGFFQKFRVEFLVSVENQNILLHLDWRVGLKPEQIRRLPDVVLPGGFERHQKLVQQRNVAMFEKMAESVIGDFTGQFLRCLRCLSPCFDHLIEIPGLGDNGVLGFVADDCNSLSSVNKTNLDCQPTEIDM